MPRKPRKALRAFIRENRGELDAAIRQRIGYQSLNDEDRRQWILNDEGLYRWAQSEGVRI